MVHLLKLVIFHGKLLVITISYGFPIKTSIFPFSIVNLPQGRKAPKMVRPGMSKPLGHPFQILGQPFLWRYPNKTRKNGRFHTGWGPPVVSWFINPININLL